MTESSSDPDRDRDPSHRSWLSSRLGGAALLQYVERFPLPTNGSPWAHVIGGTLVFLLLLEAFTGLLLLFYYRPGDAHASIAHITDHVRYGWLLRNLHRTGADAIVALALIHGFAALWRGSFRSPREITWWTGGSMAVLVAAFAFSGSLLPWDHPASYAAQVGSSVFASVPLAGPDLAAAFRGGSTIGPETVHRAFAVHIGLLPACTALMTIAHVALVHVHGLHDAESKPQSPRLRSLLPYALFAWFLAANAVIGIAALSPATVGEAANASIPPSEAVQPAWYFLAIFEVARSTSVGSYALLGAIAATAVLAATPWWGRNPKVARPAAVVVAVAFIALTFAGMGS